VRVGTGNRSPRRRVPCFGFRRHQDAELNTAERGLCLRRAWGARARGFRRGRESAGADGVPHVLDGAPVG